MCSAKNSATYRICLQIKKKLLFFEYTGTFELLKVNWSPFYWNSFFFFEGIFVEWTCVGVRMVSRIGVYWDQKRVCDASLGTIEFVGFVHVGKRESSVYFGVVVRSALSERWYNFLRFDWCDRHVVLSGLRWIRRNGELLRNELKCENIWCMYIPIWILSKTFFLNGTKGKNFDRQIWVQVVENCDQFFGRLFDERLFRKFLVFFIFFFDKITFSYSVEETQWITAFF